MKQFRWVLILGAAAVLLTAIFLIVDRRAKQEEKIAHIGDGKQLMDIDPDDVTRMSIDNGDDHLVFDWNPSTGEWELAEGAQFDVNIYSVNAVCTYFCILKTQKTVAFDCKDTSVYGFDDPVTLKIYTESKGADHPYTLLVGDSTPTYDAFYAMTDESNDVYTIDYESGLVFCSDKDLLKNQYIFDTTVSQVSYFKVERDGKTVTEISKDGTSGLWEMKYPVDYEVNRVNIEDLMSVLVRTTVSAFVEDHPTDLKQYGLDKPQAKVWLKGTNGSKTMEREIWFGSKVSDKENEQEMFAYMTDSEQVFKITAADAGFVSVEPAELLLNYCHSVLMDELKSVEVTLSDFYDLHETLTIDTENKQYALDDIDIDALHSEDVSTLFENHFRAISYLPFTDLALDDEPDPEAEPTAAIVYTYLDGRTVKLEFVPKSDTEFYLFKDGKYTGLVTRLNQFTKPSCIIPTYEALQEGIRQAS